MKTKWLGATNSPCEFTWWMACCRQCRSGSEITIWTSKTSDLSQICWRENDVVNVVNVFEMYVINKPQKLFEALKMDNGFFGMMSVARTHPINPTLCPMEAESHLMWGKPKTVLAGATQPILARKTEQLLEPGFAASEMRVKLSVTCGGVIWWCDWEPCKRKHDHSVIKLSQF